MEVGVFKQKIILYSDSQVQCIYVKHIQVKYHFIKDFIEQKEFLLKKIPKQDKSIDMGTEIVTLGKFNQCKSLLQIATL